MSAVPRKNVARWDGKYGKSMLSYTRVSSVGTKQKWKLPISRLQIDNYCFFPFPPCYFANNKVLLARASEQDRNWWLQGRIPTRSETRLGVHPLLPPGLSGYPCFSRRLQILEDPKS
ncbi:predicted protein [Coccidioides posadasii str. Silveira]|uniref:Predicted protein n=2 Tax=Coccidioides posadasii TaxID=199306 RepID=E9DBX9_COCPS|nr:predicted protein [Coccidioides posadasii str. Silveira]KMM67797.1 hypothetical protein CPAG_04130 [Coccidioides posadasii RMSCC 3488]